MKYLLLAIALLFITTILVLRIRSLEQRVKYLESHPIITISDGNATDDCVITDRYGNPRKPCRVPAASSGENKK
jgi:hypothetical protein